MDDLVQLCPSDSAIVASFKGVHNSFIAEIKVASESVYMVAIDQASLLTDCLEHVKTTLLSQIVDWRNHRFAS